MNYLSDRIMQRARAHGRGNWVCTPKDFLDPRSRAAIDRALSRPAKRGQLRRAGRGLYHWPQISDLSKQVVPPNPAQAVAAIARRDGIRVIDGGMYAANRLGLTNAVQVSPIYLTDGPTREVKVGQASIEFQHAGTRLTQWYGRPGCPVVNALQWLGRRIAIHPGNRVVERLRRQLPDDVKRDLKANITSLPSWMAGIVMQVQGDAA